MKKLLTVLLSLLIVLSAAVPGAATEVGDPNRTVKDYYNSTSWPVPPEINAYAAYVIELNSGAVLYKNNETETLFPASITKILTALVVIENCKLDEMVTFSHNAVYDIEDGGFSYVADVGDQLTVEECLYMLMLLSSNETAYALAEHVGGTVAGFADMMNSKAAELGCQHSHFNNPHGLTDPDHYTCPEDMARIFWAALQNETFRTVDSTVTYRTSPTKTNPEGVYCQMRHMMMRENSGYYDDRVVAGKTGYISAAKNTLATYAVSGDMQIITIVMRVDGAGQACIDTKALLDYGFNNFAYTDVGHSLKVADVEKAVEEKTGRVLQNISLPDTVTVLLPNSVTADDIRAELILDEDLADTDEIDGRIAYYCGPAEVGSQRIVIRLVPEPEPTTQAPTEAPTSQTAGDTSETPTQAVTPSRGETQRRMMYIIAGVLAVLVIAMIVLMIVSRAQKKKREAARKARRKAASENESDKDR